MQSSFNVPELQPFMVDNCCSPLFSADHLNSSASAAPSHAPPKHHHHHPPPPQVIHHHHHHPQQRFLHSVPITQQFFEQYNSFHAYEQQRRLHHQLGLDQDLNGSDNPGSAVAARIVNGGGPPAAAFLASNFKLGVNVNESGGGGDDDEGLLRGDDGSDGHRWQREEDSSIKEPFWKPLEIDYINRNNNDTTTTNNNNNNSDGHNNDNLKRFRDKLDTTSIKYFKKAKESNYNTTTPNDDDDDEGNHSGSNYGMFGELEAIYTTHGSSNAICGARVDVAAAAAVVGPNNHQAAAGSGSALTIENHPPAPQLESRPADESIGEEAPSPPPKKAAAVATHQKLRKKKPRRHLSSMVSFFESLMNKLTEQQESLHKAFLDTMERRDRERAERHEAWRQQEAARAAREAAVRAQERTLASAREAAIVSFLERFTGETINFPTFDEPNKEDKNKENNAVMDQGVLPNSTRWPKAEVQALIQVRSGLETRFQEPGLKGPLWEEVSASMGRLGYRRSAKRCKEKWENINKYFKKTKDSMKKRPQHTKTCPYFHQLDQIYSQKASNNANNNSNNAELLQAMIASAENNESPRDAEVAGKGLLELGRGDREEDDEGDDEEGEGEEEIENSHNTLLFGLES